MTEYACQLCHGSRHIEVGSYAAREITKLYMAKYKVDVSGYFAGEEFQLLQCCQCDLQSYRQVSCGDDLFYRQLQHTQNYYEKDKPEFSFAIDVLKGASPRHVLEVGCGSGHFLQKIKCAYEVAGEEINQAAREALRQAGIGLDSKGRQYDFIAAFQVLEHVADAHGFLSKLVDKLQPGGHLLLTVPNPESSCLREAQFVLDYPPHHLTRWSMQALENIANFFPLEKTAAYHEPLRLEHFRAMIIARRQQIVGSGLFGRIMMRLGDVFDGLYLPFSSGNGSECGITHGIVFVKTGK